MVSDDRLMEIFNGFVQWENYAATEFATAEVEEERAEADIRRIQAEGFVLGVGGSDKVTVNRAHIDSSPEMIAARGRALDAYARRKMTGVIFENCERTAAMISRELSRRIGDAGVQRRSMRWGP
jgi:hypothetical protein